MQTDAFQIQYRQEWIKGFEQMQSLCRDAVTTEAVIKGNQARFLIADSGDAETTSRGANGNIPARIDNIDLQTATLTEEHDLVKKTRFNIFASQSDQRAIMQYTSMGVINRTMDDQIITALSSATNQLAPAAAAASLQMALQALTFLGNNSVAYDGQIYAFVSPAFYGNLAKLGEFTSADFVNRKTLDNAGPQRMMQGYYEWSNIKWIVHPNLRGVGTNSCECYVFHKSAIGHACDVGGLDSAVGYNDEQDYSYCRSTVFCGATILQNRGVVKILHDDTSV